MQIADKARKQQSHTKESEWLCIAEQTKQELLKNQQYFQRLVQNPLVASDSVFSLDLLTMKLYIRDPQKIEVFGGCVPETRDLVSTPDTLAHALLDRYGEELSAVPYEKMTGIASGVFFKLAFDELQVIGEDKRWSAIRYLYPNTLDETSLLMFHAIASQDKDLFIKTASKKPNWDVKDSLGASLIHYAASIEDPFFLRELIRNNADLYTVDEQGFTAMHYAAREGAISSIKLLASSATSLLTIPSQAGESPLYIAVQNNRLQTVRFFIDSKVDLTTPAKHGMNALLCALHHGFEDIALELLGTHTFNLEYPILGKAALHMATEMKLGRAVAELVRQGANVNRDLVGRYRPIDIAIAADWLQGVKILTSTKDIKLDNLRIALDRQTEIARYLKRAVQSRTGQLLPLPMTPSSAASQPATSFNLQKAREDINWAYEQAADIRNSSDELPKDVSVDLSELKSRIAQIGASLQGHSAHHPFLQSNYESLRFQANVLTALLKSR